VRRIELDFTALLSGALGFEGLFAAAALRHGEIELELRREIPEVAESTERLRFFTAEALRRGERLRKSIREIAEGAESAENAFRFREDAGDRGIEYSPRRHVQRLRKARSERSGRALFSCQVFVSSKNFLLQRIFGSRLA
jgi:hypothetical protein